MEQTTTASTVQLSLTTISLVPPDLGLEFVATGGVPVKVGSVMQGHAQAAGKVHSPSVLPTRR